MWGCSLDVDTVPTIAVIRCLYGVGSRCVPRNDRATYPGPTLLCRWWFGIDAGANTQRTVCFGCWPVVVLFTCLISMGSMRTLETQQGLDWNFTHVDGNSETLPQRRWNKRDIWRRDFDGRSCDNSLESWQFECWCRNLQSRFYFVRIISSLSQFTTSFEIVNVEHSSVGFSSVVSVLLVSAATQGFSRLF